MSIIENLKNSIQGELLWVLFVAMLPVVELRGAIPVGVSMGLSPWVSMIVAVIGNLIPVPFIILFIRRIFEWMRTKSRKFEKFVCKMEKKAESKAKLIYKYEILGLFILVAIPLPGTGAWTGALVAAILNLRLKAAFMAIAGGVLVAGIIIMLLSVGVSAVF